MSNISRGSVSLSRPVTNASCKMRQTVDPTIKATRDFIPGGGVGQLCAELPPESFCASLPTVLGLSNPWSEMDTGGTCFLGPFNAVFRLVVSVFLFSSPLESGSWLIHLSWIVCVCVLRLLRCLCARSPHRTLWSASGIFLLPRPPSNCSSTSWAAMFEICDDGGPEKNSPLSLLTGASSVATTFGWDHV